MIVGVGGPSYRPIARASSGLPVVLSIDPSSGAVCSLAGGLVNFAKPGQCTIDANQGGNASYGSAAQIQQSITVSALQVVTKSLPTGVRDRRYTTGLVASGGNPPYTWRVVSGSLPKGVSLNGTTGVISGESKHMGTWNFTIEVKDKKTAKTSGHPASQNAASQRFSLRIAT